MTELTMVIPTQGRETLGRCLYSLMAPFHGDVPAEILVVADTYSPLLQDVAAVCREYGASYVEHDGGVHDWGYPQLTYGYSIAQGAYLMNMGDDDVAVPGALAAIRDAIAESPPGPLLFRAEMHPSPHRGSIYPTLLWAEEGRIERSWVTGQNLCCPNVPDKFGVWYDDYTHLSQTVANWGGATWRMEITARCY